jgi:hypothetical protein
MTKSEVWGGCLWIAVVHLGGRHLRAIDGVDGSRSGIAMCHIGCR